MSPSFVNNSLFLIYLNDLQRWPRIWGAGGRLAKLQSKFEYDGYNLTSMSGINLREVMKVIGGPITLGQHDLTGEELVYSKKKNPHFMMWSPWTWKRGLWIGPQKASALTIGDRIIVILILHSSQQGLIGLETAQGYEYLTVNGISEAPKEFPRDARLLLVNEACYSGSWVAATSGLKNAFLFEAASSGFTISHNHRSTSGVFCCSYFGHAFMSEDFGKCSQELWKVSRVRELVNLPGLCIHYEEAYDCLLTDITLNSLQHKIDVEAVVAHIKVFFREDEPEKVEDE